MFASLRNKFSNYRTCSLRFDIEENIIIEAFASLRFVSIPNLWHLPLMFLDVSALHCKKGLAVFPSPAGMSLIKLFLGGNNLVFSRPERVWSVTSLLGTGKWLTLFYSVPPLSSLFPHHSHSPFTKRSLRVETISLCGPPTKIFSCN